MLEIAQLEDQLIVKWNSQVDQLDAQAIAECQTHASKMEKMTHANQQQTRHQVKRQKTVEMDAAEQQAHEAKMARLHAKRLAVEVAMAEFEQECQTRKAEHAENCSEASGTQTYVNNQMMTPLMTPDRRQIGMQPSKTCNFSNSATGGPAAELSVVNTTNAIDGTSSNLSVPTLAKQPDNTNKSPTPIKIDLPNSAYLSNSHTINWRSVGQLQTRLHDQRSAMNYGQPSTGDPRSTTGAT